VVAIVAAALLPWIVSGETTRNSFTTVTAARRLGLLDESALQYVLLAWYAVPAVALFVLVQLATGQRRSAAAVAVALSIAAIALAVVVGRAPVDTAAGPAITIAAGLGTLVASVVSLAGPGRRHPTSAPTPTDRPGEAPRSDRSPG